MPLRRRRSFLPFSGLFLFGPHCRGGIGLLRAFGATGAGTGSALASGLACLFGCELVRGSLLMSSLTALAGDFTLFGFVHRGEPTFARRICHGLAPSADNSDASCVNTPLPSPLCPFALPHRLQHLQGQCPVEGKEGGDRRLSRNRQKRNAKGERARGHVQASGEREDVDRNEAFLRRAACCHGASSAAGGREAGASKR